MVQSLGTELVQKKIQKKKINSLTEVSLAIKDTYDHDNITVVSSFYILLTTYSDAFSTIRVYLE